MRADELIARLSTSRPTELPLEPGDVHAAVAVILSDRPGAGTAVLLIQRAIREGDPWSGHTAFPGGRVEPQDRSLADTARRETWEEVGLELDAEEIRGTGSDIRAWRQGRPAPVIVRPILFQVARPPSLTLSNEVQKACWTPIDELTAERNRTTHSVHDRTHPAIRTNELFVWGLTYRVLSQLFSRAGVCSLP